MKLYTKAGDDGTTGLYGGDRVPKTSSRIIAIGEIDELNASMGVVQSLVENESLAPMVKSIQNWLFDLGAELASPPGGKFVVERISELEITSLERSIDEMESALPSLKAFILPGGTKLSAQLHLARAVCRRAERSLWTLNEQETLREQVLMLVNRLSDWLFVAARTANHSQSVKDIEWTSTTG